MRDRSPNSSTRGSSCQPARRDPQLVTILQIRAETVGVSGVARRKDCATDRSNPFPTREFHPAPRGYQGAWSRRVHALTREHVHRWLHILAKSAGATERRGDGMAAWGFSSPSGDL